MNPGGSFCSHRTRSRARRRSGSCPLRRFFVLGGLVGVSPESSRAIRDEAARMGAHTASSRPSVTSPLIWGPLPMSCCCRGSYASDAPMTVGARARRREPGGLAMARRAAGASPQGVGLPDTCCPRPGASERALQCARPNPRGAGDPGTGRASPSTTSWPRNAGSLGLRPQGFGKLSFLPALGAQPSVSPLYNRTVV
jgi:hypothetical protein